MVEKSENEILLDQWTIWLRVIKTIITDKWFNVKTQDWTLVIRWTAALVHKNKKESIVYSDDHIIEVINKKENKLVPPKHAVKYTENKIEELSLSQIKIYLNDIFSQLEKIKNYDIIDIKNYKQNLIEFINKTNNQLNNTLIISKLIELKSSILKNNLNNFKKLNINWQTIYIQKENLKDLIFIPFSENLIEEKLNYIKNSINDSKIYIINKINYLIDKNNLNFDRLKDLTKIKNISNLEKRISNLNE